MPYSIRKLPNQDLYRVYNTKTKQVHSYSTTLENAKKQVKLLHMVDKKKGGAISQAEKVEIANHIRPITEEKAVKSYLDLENSPTIPPTTSRKGNEFVDYFTFLERLETEGNKGISFWDFWENKNFYMKKQYVKNLLTYLTKGKKEDLAKDLYRVFGLYFGAPMIFKPVIAMSVYARYNPNSILDFTMGWGGRLVAAAVLDVPNYIGIDLNTNLRQPYKQMVSKMKELGTTTNIKLMFKDALKVDYSKLDYDMVFTSPPYYNVEIYRGTNRMTEEEWNEEFYRPLFTKTWKYLKNGGHYIINVPSSVYENVLIDLLGEADELLPLGNKRSMSKKLKQAEYKEYMYVWNKKEKGGAGIETDRFFDTEEQIVSIPEFQSVKVELPTYMYKRLPDINGKPPPYRYRLVNPITETRNIASRQKLKSVDIKRKAIPQPFTFYEESDELPKLSDFSPKDQEKIEEYYKEVDKNEKKDRDQIENQPANNAPRGFPVTMYKTAERFGYKPVEEKVYKRRQVVAKAPKPPKPPTERKPRGRPKKPRKVINVVSDEPDEDLFASLTKESLTSRTPPPSVKEPSVTATLQGSASFRPLVTGKKSASKKSVSELSSLSSLPSLAKESVASSSRKVASPKPRAKSVSSESSISSYKSSKSGKSSVSTIDTGDLSLGDEDVEDFLNKYGIKSGKGLKNNISINSNMPNNWIAYVKEYASKNGMSYRNALRDPKCKAGYKNGGKKGSGVIDESEFADQALLAVEYNDSELGANGGKKFISL